MRKMIVLEFITLDGVIQAGGAPEEDTSGGFAYGGWQAPYSDDALGEAVMKKQMNSPIFAANTISLRIMPTTPVVWGVTTPGSSQPPKNSADARKLVVIMCVYSPRKNMANFMPLYSV